MPDWLMYLPPPCDALSVLYFSYLQYLHVLTGFKAGLNWGLDRPGFLPQHSITTLWASLLCMIVIKLQAFSEQHMSNLPSLSPACTQYQSFNSNTSDDILNVTSVNSLLGLSLVSSFLDLKPFVSLKSSHFSPNNANIMLLNVSCHQVHTVYPRRCPVCPVNVTLYKIVLVV